MRHVCAEVLIDGYGSARRHCNACRIEIQPCDVRAASRGDENGICRVMFFTVRCLDNHICAVGAVLNTQGLCARQDADAAALHLLADPYADLGVLARDKGVAVLQDSDGRSEVGVIGSELEPDVAAADDDKLLRKFVELHHRLARVDMRVLSSRNRGNKGKCACIDEDALRRDGLFSARSDDAQRVCVDKGSLAVDDNSAGARYLRIVLLAQHGREAAFFGDCRAIAFRLCREVSARCRREARTVFERLRRNACDIDAGAAVAFL